MPLPDLVPISKAHGACGSLTLFCKPFTVKVLVHFR